MAQRYEGGALVVQIGRAEGFMPRSEQIPGEQHQPGERVRCLILDVRDAGNQVKIVLSRAHPDFIRRLFEVEVPEVAERIIEVKAMAREPGHRTKIAVSSIDSKVDAVGACVGVRGSRIKNIVDELGGEKIDIVRYNESSQILIQNALRPAEVVEISLCFELGRATVVVNEDQLSLAIGKRGQNVRLAARLTQWDVDILTPAEFQKGLDTLEDTIKNIEGIREDQIDRLAALGVISVFDIEEVGIDYLVESIECEPDIAQEMLKLAAERAKVVAEQQQREKEEAAKVKAAQAQNPTDIFDVLGGAAAAGETSDTDKETTAQESTAEDTSATDSTEEKPAVAAEENQAEVPAEQSDQQEQPVEEALQEADDKQADNAEGHADESQPEDEATATV
jgi:N utilization substance protein A